MASAGRNEIAVAAELFFPKNLQNSAHAVAERREHVLQHPRLDQRLAGIRHHTFGHSQPGHLTGSMPGEDTVWSLGLHELHLHPGSRREVAGA